MNLYEWLVTGIGVIVIALLVARVVGGANCYDAPLTKRDLRKWKDGNR
jgi:hypothetical protein